MSFRGAPRGRGGGGSGGFSRGGGFAPRGGAQCPGSKALVWAKLMSRQAVAAQLPLDHRPQYMVRISRTMEELR